MLQVGPTQGSLEPCRAFQRSLVKVRSLSSLRSTA